MYLARSIPSLIPTSKKIQSNRSCREQNKGVFFIPSPTYEKKHNITSNALQDLFTKKHMIGKNLNKKVNGVILNPLSPILKNILSSSPHHFKGSSISPLHLHLVLPCLTFKFLDLPDNITCNKKRVLQFCNSNTKKDSTTLLHFFHRLYLNFTIT